MAKKMTENERFLSKEVNRLKKEIDRLNRVIGDLEDENLSLREQAKNNTPVNLQIRAITAEESLKAVVRVLRSYEVIE